ncbi:MAG: MurR/RpiR family transcriptional regulator, partial [Planctomycetota bacterium]|nr:MurR/RpiR family transcriptional regulator [Planctomycetota bacterium]
MCGKERSREVYIGGAEEYIARIKNKYDAMSRAERRLANYFLDHQYEQVGELNIKDTARRAHTSIATVVRFCRTLGFKGFSEFKYSIQAGELAPIGGKLRISSTDPIGLVKQKIAEFTKRNIATSIQCTDNRELDRAINALEKCGRMVISADGTSSGVALAAANAFTHIGIPCFFPGDSLTMLRAVYLCGKNDIVMGISNCGYIKSVVDALKVAKEHGATTIGVSAISDSLVAKYSDIVLASRIAD